MRKEYIQSLLKHLNFESIIVKYDYFIEGKLDYVLCDIKTSKQNYSSTIIPLGDGKIVTNMPDRGYIVVWSLKDNQPDIMLQYNSVYTPTFCVLENSKIVKCTIFGIQIWDTNHNKYFRINTYDYVDNLSISMDNRIITLSDKAIKIWNPHTGNVDLTIEDDLETRIIVTTKDKIITASSNKIRIRNIHTGKLEALLNNDIYGILDIKVISEELIAVLMKHNTLNFWNINTYKLEVGIISSLRCFLVLPDKRIVSGYYNYKVIIWKDYKVQFILQHDATIILLNITINHKLISVTINKNIRIWDLDTGECEVIFPILHTNIITSIITTSEGKIISGDKDGKIIVWK